MLEATCRYSEAKGGVAWPFPLGDASHFDQTSYFISVNIKIRLSFRQKNFTRKLALWRCRQPID